MALTLTRETRWVVSPQGSPLTVRRSVLWGSVSSPEGPGIHVVYFLHPDSSETLPPCSCPLSAGFLWVGGFSSLETSFLLSGQDVIKLRSSFPSFTGESSNVRSLRCSLGLLGGRAPIAGGVAQGWARPPPPCPPAPLPGRERATPCLSRSSFPAEWKMPGSPELYWAVVSLQHLRDHL